MEWEPSTEARPRPTPLPQRAVSYYDPLPTDDDEPTWHTRTFTQEGRKHWVQTAPRIRKLSPAESVLRDPYLLSKVASPIERLDLSRTSTTLRQAAYDPVADVERDASAFLHQLLSHYKFLPHGFPNYHPKSVGEFLGKALPYVASQLELDLLFRKSEVISGNYRVTFVLHCRDILAEEQEQDHGCGIYPEPAAWDLLDSELRALWETCRIVRRHTGLQLRVSTSVFAYYGVE